MEFMLDTLNLDEIKKWSEILPLARGNFKSHYCKKRGFY